MTIKIAYVALDGTEFEDKEECKEYEMTLKVNRFANFVRFCDGNLESLPLTPEGFDNALYIRIDDAEAMAFVEELADSIGQYAPWEYNDAILTATTGLYYFDDDQDGWHLAEYELHKLEEKRIELQSLLQTI